jgi:hypothetical protein
LARGFSQTVFNPQARAYVVSKPLYNSPSFWRNVQSIDLLPILNLYMSPPNATVGLIRMLKRLGCGSLQLGAEVVLPYIKYQKEIIKKRFK